MENLYKICYNTIIFKIHLLLQNMNMNRKELIEKFLEFFKSKNHREIPNSSLIPDNSGVLYTTAGMHSLVPYLLGQKHPLGKRLCNVQKCLRTDDIDKVGDSFHHTFFEMLGNWSLGDYWKEEAIKYSFEFLTKILKIPKEKLAVSCFKGDKNLKIQRDEESAKIWKNLGIPEERIAFLSKSENWWEPVGNTGPCGPDTEIFFYVVKKVPKKFNPKDKRWVEIWNDVFMQYVKDKKGNYSESSQKNVDTGMGVERTIAGLNSLEDDYLTDCFLPIIKKIENLSGKKYNKSSDETKYMRIIADHIKASVFIINEEIVPTNTERGYVLRRLIRRVIRYMKELKIKNSISKIAEPVFEIYNDYNLEKNKNKILHELEKEEQKFLESLEKGLNKFRKFISGKKKLSGKDAFLLYQSFGFPLEMIEEECKKEKIKFSKKDFEIEQRKHQELSKTALAGKFKSGLTDVSEKTIKLHTAAHLLLSALRLVLKNKNITQKGSNINPERLRLDFSFSRKLTEQEIKQIENLVNEQIKKSLEVVKKEMSLEEAKKIGALGVFEKKYKDKVSVYIINDFSKEICAGPHVKNTKELGKFKIQKEESSSSGVRRIKAVLE